MYSGNKLTVINGVILYIYQHVYKCLRCVRVHTIYSLCLHKFLESSIHKCAQLHTNELVILNLTDDVTRESNSAP
jgi:hypothetical protein